MIKYIAWLLRNLRCRRWSNTTCFLVGVVVFIVLYYCSTYNFFTHSPIKSDINIPYNLSSLENDDWQKNTKKVTILSVPWELSEPNVRGYAIQGRRFSMEDRMEVALNMPAGEDSVDVYAVLDGHGGEFSVEFARRTLLKKLARSFKDWTPSDVSVTDILRRDILATDDELLPLLAAQRDFSGCTLLLAVVHKNRLTVANVGDSRGIMFLRSGRTIPISYEHKPDRADEKARIEAAGGTVVRFGVWRVSGILAMSRALGDFTLKYSKYVIADPDIRTFDLYGDIPEFIVLATDGLWDTFANDDVGRFINESLHEPDFGAKKIVVESFDRGSMDNVSVLIVKIDSNKTVITDSSSSSRNAEKMSI